MRTFRLGDAEDETIRDTKKISGAHKQEGCIKLAHSFTYRFPWFCITKRSKCECGANFTIDHALNYPKGAFPILRDNELRDFTGDLLAEICHNVCVEPILQPLQGERLDHATANCEDKARSDIRARRFWGSSCQCAFFDIKVFNPNARSN